MLVDDLVLDDLEALTDGDPGQMLRATATAGAQVRLGAASIDRDVLGRIAADGRPRAIVVVGMGGSGISADVLSSIVGAGCPVPVWAVRGYVLPGWVGPLDLVLAVSCSGSTEETNIVAEEALRRGCRVVAVATSGSPLHRLVDGARAEFLAVEAGGRMPRANLWTMSTPLLLIADALGLVEIPPSVLAHTADLLDILAARFGPSVATGENQAKTLGLEIAGSLPMVWGTAEVGAVAAYRFACQLNENAKLPAVYGAIPESNHNQIVAVDGPLAAWGNERDTFRDRVDEPDEQVRLRLILLRDLADEHPQVSRRAEVSRQVAERRGVPVTVLYAEGEHAVVRFASIVAPLDFASVYAALALGVDPSPIPPIDELKTCIAR